MRGDAKPTPPVREKKSKFIHTVALRHGSAELSHHARHFRNARRRGEGGAETVGGKAEAVGRKAEPVAEALYRTPIRMARSIGKRQLDRQNTPRRNMSTTTSSSASARPRSATSSRSRTPTCLQGPGSTRTSRKKGSLMIKEHGPWTATSSRKFVRGSAEDGRNAETAAATWGFSVLVRRL